MTTDPKVPDEGDFTTSEKVLAILLLAFVSPKDLIDKGNKKVFVFEKEDIVITLTRQWQRGEPIEVNYHDIARAMAAFNSYVYDGII